MKIRTTLVSLLVFASLAFGFYHYMRTPVSFTQQEFSVLAVSMNEDLGTINLTMEETPECTGPNEARAFALDWTRTMRLEGCWTTIGGFVHVTWADDGAVNVYPLQSFRATPLGEVISMCMAMQPQGHRL